jgi:hypothetical protein
MPRVTAFGVLLLAMPLGCATTVRPGLANVPALSSGTVANADVHDVIANGRDACEGGLGPGPLRDQIPACPGVERPAAPPVVLHVAPPPQRSVMPWVEHFYSRWPCFSSETDANRLTLGNPPSQLLVSSNRGLSLSCAGPL